MAFLIPAAERDLKKNTMTHSHSLGCMACPIIVGHRTLAWLRVDRPRSRVIEP
jgi:hypothetical protein